MKITLFTRRFDLNRGVDLTVGNQYVQLQRGLTIIETLEIPLYLKLQQCDSIDWMSFLTNPYFRHIKRDKRSLVWFYCNQPTKHYAIILISYFGQKICRGTFNFNCQYSRIDKHPGLMYFQQIVKKKDFILKWTLVKAVPPMKTLTQWLS